MKKFSEKIVNLAACFFIVFFVISEVSPPLITNYNQKMLMGFWQTKDGKARLEFKPDGTASLVDGTINHTGNVEFFDHNRLMIGNWGIYRFRFKNKDELFWKMDTSLEERFVRMK